MSFIGDLLSELVVNGVAEGVLPESPKGRLIIFGLIGFELAAVMGWVIAVSPDPLNEPRWSFHLFVCAVIYGSPGVLISGLYLARQEAERGPALFCLSGNVLAVAIPIMLVAG